MDRIFLDFIKIILMLETTAYIHIPKDLLNKSQYYP